MQTVIVSNKQEEITSHDNNYDSLSQTKTREPERIIASVKETHTPVVAITPSITPLPTKKPPQYIVYNPKDIYGAPFYTNPDGLVMIRSLPNQTVIEMTGVKETHNYLEWSQIRDDKGVTGWIQSRYISTK